MDRYHEEIYGLQFSPNMELVTLRVSRHSCYKAFSQVTSKAFLNVL